MASFAPEQDLLRVGEIVLAAAVLDPREREAFLRRVTLSQPDLLAEVRRRLELAAALPGSFLAVPAAELLAAAQQAIDSPAIEDVDGGPRYVPEECVGEGGMARVHKAFDRQLQRWVALKFLDCLEPDARRRFLREAHAHARVRHDNVLEVYEAGELEGRPFIAMRWVDGPTLLGIRGETSLEQKVRLVAQVAEGLHAAHREGLIHRDVKPSNVLVERTPDGDWKPWVADFGIALWREAGSGERLAGTPAYLAPELLRGGPADRRADVYGLGVTLCEFLTGEAPFRAPDLVELLRQVREDAPRPPREILPGLPAELEAIVLKCLEKDPEARYPSARALAEDLRRFLDGDAVEAHAATFAYRLTKLVVRHRRLLAVAGAAAVLLVIALSIAAVLGVEARVANRRAEARRSQAEDLIGFMLTDLRGKLAPLGKLEILDDVGKRALGYFAAVPQGELSDEELARRSQALYQIGDVRIKQGDLTGALAPLQESLALARALAGREPSAERLFGLGQSEFWVGYVDWEQGDLAAARPHFEAYRDLSERLIRMEPQRLDYHLELAFAHSNLGSLQRQAGALAPALASFEKSLAIKQRLAAQSPARLEGRFEVAATHDLIGLTLVELGRLREAHAHFEAQRAQLQALVQADPDSFRFRDYLGTAHASLAAWHEVRGELAEALASALRAQEIFAGLADRDPANRLWRWKLELSRESEGYFRLLRGERRQSLSILAPMAESVARHLAEEPGDRDLVRGLAKALVLLGRIEHRRGDAAAAAAAWDRARSRLEPAVRRSGSMKLLEPWAAVLLLLHREAEARSILAELQSRGYLPVELVNLCREQGVEIPLRRETWKINR
ncbi:MAG TPA: serine/threonine-protein kinase [Thermoanaerobaculia bacterium]|nr:serine/threonine-protein kinase [Thermoanaerobaculia bacterium]